MSTSVLAIVGLVTLCVAWIIGFVMPQIRVMTYIIVGLGAALVAAAVILDFRRVSGAIASRRGLFGFGAGAGMALVLGIVLMANAISVRVNYRFDFTGLSQFTLTTQTKEVLEELEEPVEVVSFFNPTDPRLLGLRDFGHNLLTEYQTYTDLLTLRVEDPELRPDLARQYRIGPAAASLGTMVFVGSAGQRQVFGPQIGFEAEHAFTSALLEVTGTKQRIIYFLTGHGESEISGDYDSARSGLRDNLFQVASARSAALRQRAGQRRRRGDCRSAAADLRQASWQSWNEYLQQAGRHAAALESRSAGGVARVCCASGGCEVGDGALVDPASHVVPNVDNPLVARNAQQPCS